MSLLYLIALVVLGVLALWAVALWKVGWTGRVALGVLAGLSMILWMPILFPTDAAYREALRTLGPDVPDSAEVVARATSRSIQRPRCRAAIIAVDSASAERWRAYLEQWDEQHTPRSDCWKQIDDALRYDAVSRSSKDGYGWWWGVSEDGRFIAFEKTEI